MNTSGQGAGLHLGWKAAALEPVSLIVHWLELTQRERCHLQSQQHRLPQQHIRVLVEVFCLRITWPCLWVISKSKCWLRWHFQNRKWKENEENGHSQLEMLHPRIRNKSCSLCYHYAICKPQEDTAMFFPLVVYCLPPTKTNKIFYST